MLRASAKNKLEQRSGFSLLLPLLLFALILFVRVQRAYSAQRATVDAVCRIECIEYDVRDRMNRPRIGQGTANVIHSGNGFSLLITNAHCIPRGGRGKIVLTCPHVSMRGKILKVQVVACNRDFRHDRDWETVS